MGNITKLQKLLLEKIIESKDVSQYLPEHLKTEGVVEVLGTSVNRDYDKPDLYEIAIKFKIRPDTENDEIRIAEEQNVKTELIIESVDSHVVYNPEMLSNLSGLSQQIKSSHKPFLFTVNSLETITKIGSEKRLPLPEQITIKCDTNGNHMSMGLFDFKGYWSIRLDGDLEMVLLPKQNHDMLDNDTKSFLQKQYTRETHIMHYQNGLDLPNIPIINNAVATVRADKSPFAIVRIDKKYVINDEGYRTVNEITTEQDTIPKAETGRKRSPKEELESKESLIKEFPGAKTICSSSYYGDMYKFEVDNELREVNKQRIITPPSKIVKEYMGKEKYKRLDKGETITDFVMRYHKTDNDFDIALMPKFNLSLLESNMDSAKDFLEYFNNVFDTSIKVYGQPTAKVLVISMPEFAREVGNQINFFANNDFYVRMQKSKQKIGPE